MTLPLADLDELASSFITCEIPHEQWTHSAHLMMGAWHIHRYGPAEALSRLRNGIRGLNDSHGTPNSATRGYHETITRAYVLLISQFLADCPTEMPLADCVARLLASPLADRNTLLAFYSRDTLMSVAARAAWVEPDRAPLCARTILDAAQQS